MPMTRHGNQDRTKSPLSEQVKQAEEAIELISTGLLLIADCDLDRLGGTKLVDITARLNAQYCALEKYIEPMKSMLKTQSLESKLPVIVGINYQAEIRHVTKIMLDQVKLKDWLGKKWNQFTKPVEQIVLTFKIKQ